MQFLKDVVQTVVEDLIEKNSKTIYSSTRFILFIFSTWYFNLNDEHRLNIHFILKTYSKPLIAIYFSDELNCTWGSWSMFSPCSATCGEGFHYRERSCEGADGKYSGRWCSRSEIDIQTCSIAQCKPGK